MDGGEQLGMCLSFLDCGATEAEEEGGGGGYIQQVPVFI